MEQTQNETPRGNRVHIGFFGRRNVGKSSLVNAITGQQIAIVSEIRGTTTDPIEKAMELLPIGPVVIIDTPGFDDEGALGKLRVARTKDTLSHTDLAVLVIDAACGMTPEDKILSLQLNQRNIPFLLVWNKWDTVDIPPNLPENAIAVSTVTGEGISILKERLGSLYQTWCRPQHARTLFGNLLAPEDAVLLVTPIDSAAPKGRLILPQVQAIRDILDKRAICLVVQPEQLATCCKLLQKPPKLVVTDSQAFSLVKNIIPDTIPLTSFSILFAHYKGFLQPAIQAVKVLEALPEQSRILIAEGCTHHRQCDDIGTVKLPYWIQRYTKKTLNFDFTSGNTFPDDLSPYSLVVHCGGCMLNEREIQSRAARAAKQTVPFTNYGTLIAYLQGILARSLEIFKAVDK